MAVPSRNHQTVEQDEGRWGRRAIKPRVCIGFSGTYTCAAAGAVGRGGSRARQTKQASQDTNGGGVVETRGIYAASVHAWITHRRTRRQNEHRDRRIRACMRGTYVFSRRVVYPLGLVTDLHEMVQLVKKLLTGTMDLDTTPARHRSAKGSLVSSRTSRVSRGILSFFFFFYFFLSCSVPSRVCVRVVKYQHPGADLQAPRTRTPASYNKREYEFTPLFPFVLTYFFS